MSWIIQSLILSLKISIIISCAFVLLLMIRLLLLLVSGSWLVVSLIGLSSLALMFTTIGISLCLSLFGVSFALRSMMALFHLFC